MFSVRFGEWVASRRKAAVTVATFLAGVIDLQLVDGSARVKILLALLALNAVGVHQVSNEPTR